MGNEKDQHNGGCYKHKTQVSYTAKRQQNIAGNQNGNKKKNAPQVIEITMRPGQVKVARTNTNDQQIEHCS